MATAPYSPPADINVQQINPEPDSLNPAVQHHWCPGCGHGSVAQMLAEVISELNLENQVVLAPGVGCGTAIWFQLDLNTVICPHGRASDIATGISRALPDRTVVQYSGDGDSCAIGLAGLIHACNRRENFLIFIYNNNVYGMTGGQIGPTTCEVIPTTTFQQGRPEDVMGFPMDIIKMVAPLPGVAYAARVTTSSGVHLVKARRAIKKAFQIHLAGVKGIKIVDILGNCNVNWKGGETTFTPQTANDLIEEKVIDYFPLGEFFEPENWDGGK